MSCQLIVCTPRHYFTELLLLDDQEAVFSDFVQFLAARGVHVDPADGSEEFLCEDLRSRPWLDLIDICADHSEQVCLDFQQSIFLPVPQQEFQHCVFKRSVVSEGTENPLELHCGTVDSLDRALDFIMSLPEYEALRSHGGDHENVIETHRVAIRAATAFNQPIFTSA
jgi:hypothetical protein